MVATIVEAAARVLAEEGLDAVTTNRVAARAGVSVGSLYQYYPNRSAILADLLRDKLAVLRGGIEEAMAEHTLDAGMRAMLDALARSYLDRPALASALLYVETVIGGDEDIRVARAALGASVTAFLVRHGVADAPVAARDLVAMSRAIAMAAGIAGETDHAAVVARMARAATGYLGRPARASV